MSLTKDLTILALTKMHGGVCTAGIDADGHWVRPVRPQTEQARKYETVSDYCLLPLDFFHGGQAHLVNLGVTRCWFTEAAAQPPHAEDWLLDLKRKPQLLRKLTAEEQAAFLATHAEERLVLLEQNRQRSLALIRPASFSFSFQPNATGDDVTVRASFTLGETKVEDAGCTDLRLRVLGRRLLEKSNRQPRSLNESDFARQGKESTYLSVGLSRPFQGRHWLLVVGVHTLPELVIDIDYAKL